MSKKYPVYITRYEIDQSELSEFVEGGEHKENIDSTGNQIIKTDSDTVENCFITIRQVKTEFSKDKIEQNYETKFTEFSDLVKSDDKSENLSIEDDVTDINNAHQNQENILNNQLEELTKILEVESQKNIKFKEDAQQNYLATKNLIIDMRIKNGEGNNPEDFSDAFPFSPLSQENTSTTDYNPIPFLDEPR